MPRIVPLLIFCGLLIANISIYRAVYAPKMSEIRVFSVGKGNAIIVQTPRNKTLLIDAGSDAGILRVLGSVLPMWRRSIDAVILTSADTKSTGGLPDVTSRYHTPAPVRFGARTSSIPYGTTLTFDTDMHITVIAPHTLTISYGATAFAFSSSTPALTYRTDGVSVQK